MARWAPQTARQAASRSPGRPCPVSRVRPVNAPDRRQILGPPRPRGDQRLHAHKRHRPLRGQLRKHPPPVPGRLTRHRHPGPAPRRSPARGPVQRRAKIPGAAPERPPRDDLSSRDRSPRPSACCPPDRPHDRVRHRHQGAQALQPRVAVAVTSGYATTVTHERPPAAQDTKPEAHQGDVPTSRTDTQNVFLCRVECAIEVVRPRHGQILDPARARAADADAETSPVTPDRLG